MDMIVKSESLSRVAGAIREKGKTVEPLVFPDGFSAAIMAIQSGGVHPQLVVTAPAGSTITAVNGEETVTGVVGTEGTLTLDLPAFGTWSVTARLNGQEASTSVYIKQENLVSLSYGTTFTVNGGHGETITVREGATVLDTVPLNSDGVGTVTLIGVGGKTLTFTGGLSGYVKSVEVGNADEMTVNVYPDGALYWYGREFEEKTGGWVYFNQSRLGSSGYWSESNSGFVKGTNDIQIGAIVLPASRCACGTDFEIDFNGYTKIDVEISAYENASPHSNRVYTALVDNTPSLVSMTTGDSVGVLSIPLDASTPSQHIIVATSLETSGYVKAKFNKVVLK